MAYPLFIVPAADEQIPTVNRFPASGIISPFSSSQAIFSALDHYQVTAKDSLPHLERTTTNKGKTKQKMSTSSVRRSTSSREPSPSRTKTVTKEPSVGGKSRKSSASGVTSGGRSKAPSSSKHAAAPVDDSKAVANSGDGDNGDNGEQSTLTASTGGAASAAGKARKPKPKKKPIIDFAKYDAVPPPPKPNTAYIEFAADLRAEHSAIANAPVRQQGGMVSKKWHELSDADKDARTARARLASKVWKDQLAEWEKKYPEANKAMHARKHSIKMKRDANRHWQQFGDMPSASISSEGSGKAPRKRSSASSSKKKGGGSDATPAPRKKSSGNGVKKSSSSKKKSEGGAGSSRRRARSRSRERAHSPESGAERKPRKRSAKRAAGEERAPKRRREVSRSRSPSSAASE